MGFALWIATDTAWCAGTHEYRPMGVAVIAASSLFSARDFHPLRQGPRDRSGEQFRGLFASLPDVNSFLQWQRRTTVVPSAIKQRRLQRQLAIVRLQENK